MKPHGHGQLDNFSWLQLKLLKAGWEVQFGETTQALEKSLKGLVTPVKGNNYQFSQPTSESRLDTPPQLEAISKMRTSSDNPLYMSFGYTMHRPNSLLGHYTPLVDICNQFKHIFHLNSFTLRHDLGTEVRPGNGFTLIAHCYRAQLTLAGSPDDSHAYIIIVLEDTISHTRMGASNLLKLVQTYEGEGRYIVFFKDPEFKYWVYWPLCSTRNANQRRNHDVRRKHH